MLDLLPQVDAWLADDQSIALATVVKVWGSAPRPLGSKMTISSGGGMAGSVSGGCVEGAVVEAAAAVLATGEPKLVSFGVSHDEAFAVGLLCGGTIEIFIERWSPEAMAGLRADVEARRLVARAVVLRGSGGGSDGSDGESTGRQALIRPSDDGAVLDGSLGDDGLDQIVSDLALRGFAEFASFRDTSMEEDTTAPRDLFVDILPPPPRLIIVGAVHAAVHLVAMARVAGFETIVVDPRTAFATAERFAHADRLLHTWPDEALEELAPDANTYVALLSHDLKLDVPALRVALPRARYVGALGSRETQAKRLARLEEETGIGGDLAARIHNPIGLDLGGRSAEEIAVSVLAEVVAVRHGKDFRPIP